MHLLRQIVIDKNIFGTSAKIKMITDFSITKYDFSKKRQNGLNKLFCTTCDPLQSDLALDERNRTVSHRKVSMINDHWLINYTFSFRYQIHYQWSNIVCNISDWYLNWYKIENNQVEQFASHQRDQFISRHEKTLSYSSIAGMAHVRSVKKCQHTLLQWHLVMTIVTKRTKLSSWTKRDQKK